ncbi:MAG: ATP-binding cassette domain-containing protein [Atopostipes sp.]|nr:ATP-binding cassette domain-containing protein [Atopostipes sp.]
MITLNDVSLQFSGRKLYEDINLKFTPGNCYGVIGANGAGKSTLLKIISGEIEPTTGEVFIEADKRIASLNQDHFAFDEYQVLDTVIMGHKRLYEVMKEKNEIYSNPDFSEEDGVRAAELESAFAELNGWEAESEAAQLLDGLGVPNKLHNKKMADLLERDKVRVLLAQALFGSPDILLLDEPTNGLDDHTINWLNNFIIDFQNTVIVVSHDRYFLNTVCTHTCDVDYGKVEIYAGNYDFWKQSSELASKLQADQRAKKEEKIEELEAFIARFSANASKSKQATSRKKTLDKIELEDIKPSSRKYPFINFKPEREIGNDLLIVKNISKSIDGELVLDNISFTLKPEDKVAFLSRNDLATTTLYQILMGEIEPDSGSFKWGVTTSQSYLPSDTSNEFEDKELTILEWLSQYTKNAEQENNTFLRSFLGRMLFSGEEVNKKVNILSGGEKVRCILSKMMLAEANVLLMDDPTNHLDLESISSLNEGLISFNGALLFSSHDREFIETIANRIIHVSANGMVDRLDTNYEEYLANEEVQARIDALYN